jgi:hypothetical protein
MMNDVSCIIHALHAHGEVVKVTCDHEGWTIEHGGMLVYRARDERDALGFLGGLASYHLRDRHAD